MTLATTARSILRRLGVKVRKDSYNRRIWLDYSVSKEPRYGYRLPKYAAVLRILERRRPDFERVVDEIGQRAELLSGIPAEPSGDPLKPYWNNSWFPPLDACVLMHFILKHSPKRYLEIGSGNSTIFARHAIRSGGLPTKITSIDPQPRAGIDRLCDRVIRTGLEQADLSVFDELEPGDILFFDGSHRVFQDSDVTVFFLEVLPKIRSGVLVHIHDIFWPKDYPPAWGDRYYSEQYMLAMLLLHGGDKNEIMFASAYARDEFASKVSAVTNGDPELAAYEASFWFKPR